MWNRIPVSVQQRCVPVTNRLVSLGRMERQPNVLSDHIQFAIVTREHNERRLGSVAMMPLTILREIHHDRIIEHRPSTLGNSLQSVHDCGDLFHVAYPHFLANIIR